MSATAANDLLQNAVNSGLLSASSMASLQHFDLGQNIQNALGTSADDIDAAETTIIKLVIDDSSSIAWARNPQTRQTEDHSHLIIEGQNMILDALRGKPDASGKFKGGSKVKDGILISTSYINGKLLQGFVQVDEAIAMDAYNYVANGNTPLYDSVAQSAAELAAKVQEFKDQGVPARGILAIVTDGADMGSTRFTPGKVASIIGDLLASESFIVSAMGIDDGHTDFKQVFTSMGFPDQWILTPSNSEKDIRAAWNQMSQSASQASMNAGSFSQTSMGGFGS